MQSLNIVYDGLKADGVALPCDGRVEVEQEVFAHIGGRCAWNFPVFIDVVVDSNVRRVA